MPFLAIYRILFFLVGLSSAASPRGLTPLMIGFCLILGLELRFQQGLPWGQIWGWKRHQGLSFFLGGLGGLSLISTLFGLEPEVSFRTWLKIIPLFFLGSLLLTAGEKKSFSFGAYQSLMGGWILGLFFLLIDVWLWKRGKAESTLVGFFNQRSSFHFSHYNQGVYALLLLAGPVFYWMRHQSREWGLSANAGVWILTGFLGVVTFLSGHDTCKVSFVLGFIMYFILYGLSRSTIKNILYGFVFFVFITPFILPRVASLPSVEKQLFQQIQKTSFYHRLGIWKEIQKVAFDDSFSLGTSSFRLVFGFGLESCRAKALSQLPYVWRAPLPLSEKKKNRLPFWHEKNLFDFPKITTIGFPLHPHNLVLQVFLDLGLLGVLLLGFLLHLCLQKLLQFPSENTPDNRFRFTFSCTTFMVFLVMASASYGIWQSWLICLLWIVVSFWQNTTYPESRKD